MISSVTWKQRIRTTSRWRKLHRPEQKCSATHCYNLFLLPTESQLLVLTWFIVFHLCTGSEETVLQRKTRQNPVRRETDGWVAPKCRISTQETDVHVLFPTRFSVVCESDPSPKLKTTIFVLIVTMTTLIN